MNVFSYLNQLGIMRKQWHREGWDLAKMIQLVSYRVKVIGIHAFHSSASNCLSHSPGKCVFTTFAMDNSVHLLNCIFQKALS